MFERLIEELHEWGNSGELAEFWWRDDDIQTPSSLLDRLLSISDKYDAPLSLAAIPEGIDSSLATTIQNTSSVAILQHGYNHSNHAPTTMKKMELGANRVMKTINNQLLDGFQTLQELFGDQFAPVMVPPWNRIDPIIAAQLKEIGFKGLSTLGPRNETKLSTDLVEVNVHVDIINWKDNRSFAGDDACITQIVQHLTAKREGRADPTEPTGIMSHHLVHDNGCWEFLESIFTFLSEHEFTRTLDAKKIFSVPPLQNTV